MKIVAKSRIYGVLHSDKAQEVTRNGREEVSSRINAHVADIYVVTTVNARGLVWVEIKSTYDGHTLQEFSWRPQEGASDA